MPPIVLKVNQSHSLIPIQFEESKEDPIFTPIEVEDKMPQDMKPDAL